MTTMFKEGFFASVVVYSCNSEEFKYLHLATIPGLHTGSNDFLFLNNGKFFCWNRHLYTRTAAFVSTSVFAKSVRGGGGRKGRDMEVKGMQGKVNKDIGR
jgi:hypothetical protein